MTEKELKFFSVETDTNNYASTNYEIVNRFNNFCLVALNDYSKK